MYLSGFIAPINHEQFIMKFNNFFLIHIHSFNTKANKDATVGDI